ncbi:MAG: right-handed parallel beta-helix repeat-containing protein [Planctomycetes bacterium]|nr:right-handed parallel beta-helix repeat-containing protein [Planctomycetota bacterium]
MLRVHSFLAAAALLIASGAVVSGADWFASPSAPAGGSGRSPDAAFRTVQQAVSAAVPGDTVYLRGGTYREEVTVTKAASAAAPIVITAYPGEQPVIKGSLIASGWTPHQGAIWKRSGWTYKSQQVFVDGASLQQIGMPAAYGNGVGSDGVTMITAIGSNVASMFAGSFFYDAATSTLYAWLRDGGDPNGHVMEASAFRRLLFMGSSTFVTVANVTFRHSSTAAYMIGGAAVELGTDCTMRDCDVQWCDFAGVSLGYQQSRAAILRSVVSNNGCVGISTGACSNFSVSQTTMSNNNYRGFNTQWHAGGMKITSKGWGIVDACTVSGNRGCGLWFDYANSGNAIILSRNWISGNSDRAAGIMLEVTKNVSVHDNVIVANDNRGIYVASSDNIDVLANTITGTRGYHAVDISGMPRAGASLTNVRVIGNVISGNACTRDLFVLKENGTDIVNLRCDNNLFDRAGGPILRWSADGRGNWVGTTCTSLSAWQTATPFDRASVEGDPLFIDAVSGDFRLRLGSPAIDRNQSLPFPVDFAGVARTIGSAPDIGAYECAYPTLTCPATAAGTVGSWFSYQITATNAPTRFTASGLPAGLALDAAGVISGYPTAGGDTQVAISAGNSSGVATGSLLIAVNALPTVAITGPGDGTAVTTPADVVLSANAQDDRGVAAVEFYEGATRLGVCTSAPYAYTWTSPPVGAHVITARVVDSDGVAALSAPVTVTVRAIVLFAARVNFQPAASPTVAGWMVDSGLVYGDRGGVTYGWNLSTPDARDRNKIADQLRDTCILMQGATNRTASWELAVPNGLYQVHVVCGDPSYFDGLFKLDVEGVRAVDGRATSAVPFWEGTVTVRVGDGRLTLTNADGSYNTKICCVEIQQVPAAGG